MGWVNAFPQEPAIPCDFHGSAFDRYSYIMIDIVSWGTLISAVLSVLHRLPSRSVYAPYHHTTAGISHSHLLLLQ